MAEPMDSEELNLESNEDSHQSYSLVGRGQALQVQVKQAIVNLKCYFQTKFGWNSSETISQISEALKISQTTVQRVISEEKRTKTLSAPKHKRVRKGFEFDTNDRQIMISLCKEVTKTTKTATVADVLAFMRDNKNREDIKKLKFKDCKTYTTFRKIFKTMGLKFGQINGKNVLMLKNMVKVKQQTEKEKPKPTPKPFKSKIKPMSASKLVVTPPPPPIPMVPPMVSPKPQSSAPSIVSPFPKGSLIAVPITQTQPIFKPFGNFQNNTLQVVMNSGIVQPKLILANNTLMNSPNLLTSGVNRIIAVKQIDGSVNNINNLRILRAAQPQATTRSFQYDSTNVRPDHNYTRVLRVDNSVKNQKKTNKPNIVVIKPMSTKQPDLGTTAPTIVKLVETGASNLAVPTPIPIITSLTVKEEVVLPAEPLEYD